ncbi:unnamed protein product, partial [Phytomonas sp. EM1]
MGILEHAVRQWGGGVARRRPAAAAARSASTASLSPSPAFSTVRLEAKAHALMMDLARFHLTPTEFTMNSYIAVCGGCGVMHLAVAAVADYFSRHERQPSAGIYAALLHHLLRNGQPEKALAVLTTMQNVPMTTALLNAVLHAARYSPDPASIFTFYRAIVRSSSREGVARAPASSASRINPDLATFSILLEGIWGDLQTHLESPREAEEETGGRRRRDPPARETLKWRNVANERLDFLLAEMRALRVRGNGQFLNTLLRVMLQLGRHAEARALRASMRAKHVIVFDELREEEGRGSMQKTPPCERLGT